MTEAEWIKDTDPQRMLRSLNMRWKAAARRGGQVNFEKFRLFACACCRRNWILLGEHDRQALQMLEDYSPTDGSLGTIRKARKKGWSTINCGSAKTSARFIAWANSLASCAVYEASEEEPTRAAKAHLIAARASGSLERAKAVAGTPDDQFIAGSAVDWHFVARAELAHQVTLIQDIFGNPFRQAAIEPFWRTPSVLALANAAYEERTLPNGTLNSDRLAVLADALEDVGCNNTDILDHLRSPGPHVRGCWPLDFLLEKE